MSFLLQLDLRAPLKLSRQFMYAYLFTCSGYEEGRNCDTYYGDYGANAVVLVAKTHADACPSPPGAVRRPERSIQWSLYEPDEDCESTDSGRLDVEAAQRLVAAWESRSNPDDDITIYVEPPDDRPTTLLLGGDPVWLQNDDTPSCPACQGPMVLLAQIDAEIERWRSPKDQGYWLPFGGGGVGYMFLCQAECGPTGSYFCWQTT
jgi:hypothetical protein